MKVQHVERVSDQAAGGPTGHVYEGVHDQDAGGAERTGYLCDGASPSSSHHVMPGKSITIEPNYGGAGGHACDQVVQGGHGVQCVQDGGVDGVTGGGHNGQVGGTHCACSRARRD